MDEDADTTESYYENKYLKYKQKYLSLKNNNLYGGGGSAIVSLDNGIYMFVFRDSDISKTDSLRQRWNLILDNSNNALYKLPTYNDLTNLILNRCVYRKFQTDKIEYKTNFVGKQEDATMSINKFGSKIDDKIKSFGTSLFGKSKQQKEQEQKVAELQKKIEELQKTRSATPTQVGGVLLNINSITINGNFIDNAKELAKKLNEKYNPQITSNKYYYLVMYVGSSLNDNLLLDLKEFKL